MRASARKQDTRYIVGNSIPVKSELRISCFAHGYGTPARKPPRRTKTEQSKKAARIGTPRQQRLTIVPSRKKDGPDYQP